MDIHIFDNQTDLSISANEVKQIVEQVLADENRKCDEVAIHFVGEATICHLHADHFGDPSPTDCISFPMDDVKEKGYNVLGEVFVCPLTAIKYAKEHKEDPYIETTLYIIHGLLHLLGYDDLEDETDKAMRAAETKHLNTLKTLNMCLKGPSI